MYIYLYLFSLNNCLYFRIHTVNHAPICSTGRNWQCQRSENKYHQVWGTQRSSIGQKIGPRIKCFGISRRIENAWRYEEQSHFWSKWLACFGKVKCRVEKQQVSPYREIPPKHKALVYSTSCCQLHPKSSPKVQIQSCYTSCFLIWLPRTGSVELK